MLVIFMLHSMNKMDIIIRPERPEDNQKIRHINIKAFDTEAESNLIDA